MKRAGNIALLAATGLEGLAAIAWLRGGGVPALLVHLAACGGAAELWRRRVLRGPVAWSFILVFSSLLFVPLLGALGLLAISFAMPDRDPAPESDWIMTRIPRPPGPVREEPSGASEPCGPEAERQARVDAVTALRRRRDPNAVGLLRRALADRDEDLRLLAHALLDSKSRTAFREIDEMTRALEEAPEARRGAIHRRLASQYWDLAWLGLVQGDCLEHALAAARLHTLAALEWTPESASLHFLLGRIHLRADAPEPAQAAFLRARDLGLPAMVVRPYLAESAFLQRRFDLVRSHLAAMPVAPSVIVARMRRYWT